jgi:hypothetical protein
MFQDSSSNFISNSPLYVAGAAPLRGFVNIFQIAPGLDTDTLSQPPVLTYEMDFADITKVLVLNLN